MNKINFISPVKSNPVYNSQVSFGSKEPKIPLENENDSFEKQEDKKNPLKATASAFKKVGGAIRFCATKYVDAVEYVLFGPSDEVKPVDGDNIAEKALSFDNSEAAEETDDQFGTLEEFPIVSGEQDMDDSEIERLSDIIEADTKQIIDDFEIECLSEAIEAETEKLISETSEDIVIQPEEEFAVQGCDEFETEETLKELGEQVMSIDLGNTQEVPAAEKEDFVADTSAEEDFSKNDVAEADLEEDFMPQFDGSPVEVFSASDLTDVLADEEDFEFDEN